MRKSLLVALVCVMTLGGCATLRESRVNPFNWFGGSRSEPVEVADERVVVDGRQLVDQVISLNVDAYPGGAIVRAVGLPPTQGYWEADLVRIETDDPANLVYEFRMLPPPGPTRQSTQRSREIIAGANIGTARLRDVRTITVVAFRNRRSVRR